jgi:hypothetical protein
MYGGFFMEISVVALVVCQLSGFGAGELLQ